MKLFHPHSLPPTPSLFGELHLVMTQTNLSSSFCFNVLSHLDNANSVSLTVPLKVSV